MLFIICAVYGILLLKLKWTKTVYFISADRRTQNSKQNLQKTFVFIKIKDIHETDIRENFPKLTAKIFSISPIYFTVSQECQLLKEYY